jgi:long-chain fatty acid transport protein
MPLSRSTPRSRPRARALVVLALAALPASSASASPEDIFGYGPRSTAMAGTGAASSDDYEAAYTNPALLSRLRLKTLVIGYQDATFNLHANGPGLPGSIGYDPATGILIGIGLPVPFGGVLKDRVGLGIDFYTPSSLLVRGNIPYPETPQYVLLPDRAQTLAIRAGIGLDLGYGIRVGGGFGALAELDGSVVVSTSSTGGVGSTVQDQLVAVYAPTFGATFDVPVLLGHPFRVGVTYRGQLEARFAVDIDATKLSTLNIPVLNISGIAQFDPAEVAFEAAYDTKPFTVAVGATYKKWSAYPGPLEPTTTCPPALLACAALPTPNVTFHDTVVPRIGVERTLLLSQRARLHLRAGYAFEPTPSPGETPSSQAIDAKSNMLVNVQTRYFDASRNIFAFGTGIEIPPVTLDAYGQVHVLVPRTITLDTATPAPTSFGAVPPLGGPSTTAELGGTVLACGVTLGVKF